LSFIKLGEDIDGEEFFVVSEDGVGSNEIGGTIEVPRGKYTTDIYLFKDEEEAGQFARDYWADYIDHESSEDIVCMMGAETLVSWALGKLAGPGSVKVRNLEEWLDLYLEAPDEHFESGPFEIEAIGENIVEKLGFKPTVAYSMG
tara:strand:- start:36 stop:470 length:435 start_codon:yes stop_codon:yes gene_type:complete